MSVSEVHLSTYDMWVLQITDLDDVIDDANVLVVFVGGVKADAQYSVLANSQHHILRYTATSSSR